MSTLSYTVSFLFALSFVAPQETENYSPLDVNGTVKIVDTEFSYGDEKRVVPLRMYLPETTQPAATILFSHGLGGTREAGTFLGKHWAGRGYIVVTMQHAGSDRSVVKDVPLRKKLDVLKKAASAENAQARWNDVAATIDHLESLNKKGAKYEGRFDLQKIGMGGHSFGAVTTQGASGQSYGRYGQKNTDKRIKAALALSPSPPSIGQASQAFGNVAIPWMLMTGTEDQSIIARTTPEKRREVFRNLPASGHAYQLVLDGAEHVAFADESAASRFLRKSERNPNHHKAIQALSTAFWDTYLNNDKSAKQWLNSDEARSVLEKADVWQKK